MIFPRRVRRLPFRHMLAVAAIFAQFVAATGAPVLSSRTAKDSSVPFPCQNHPCGCTTPEQGWAGDCCCFTLEEKLAWADARGIEPPSHVRPTVEARKATPKKKSCCETHAPHSCCDTKSEEPPSTTESLSVKWIAGVFTQKCHGDAPGGLLKLEISSPPAHASEVRITLPVCESVTAFDSHIASTSSRPPIPPPRVS